MEFERQIMLYCCWRGLRRSAYGFLALSERCTYQDTAYPCVSSAGDCIERKTKDANQTD